MEISSNFYSFDNFVHLPTADVEGVKIQPKWKSLGYTGQIPATSAQESFGMDILLELNHWNIDIGSIYLDSKVATKKRNNRCKLGAEMDPGT